MTICKQRSTHKEWHNFLHKTLHNSLRLVSVLVGSSLNSLGAAGTPGERRPGNVMQVPDELACATGGLLRRPLSVLL
jgi:hypothetical protein